MATIKRFEDIESWKLGNELCSKIGKHIDEGKFKKNFRLIDQMEGSSGEFRSQLYRALNRGYITEAEFEELYSLATSISGKLQKFIEYLLKTEIAGSRKNLKR